MQEEQQKEIHDDFDEVIDKVLVPAWEKNPAIRTEWLEKGGTAKLAYQMGQKIKQSSEILDDPEAYEKKLRDKIAEEQKSGGGNGQASDDAGTEWPKTTLSGVNSHNAAPPGKKGNTMSANPLDSFFEELRKEKESRLA